jgi:protein phosphatase 1G
VNENLNLSRSIGDLEFKRNHKLNAREQIITSTPDVVKLKREGVDFLIMGCDGIWESKSS